MSRIQFIVWEAIRIRGFKYLSQQSCQMFICGMRENVTNGTLNVVKYYFLTAGTHIQCSPLNRIALGRFKSDNNNRMIQLTEVCCYCTNGPAISDYNKRLILLTVIQLSGGHCTYMVSKSWSKCNDCFRFFCVRLRHYFNFIIWLYGSNLAI